MVAAGFVCVPGTWSGLGLRVSQCTFATASAAIMFTSIGTMTYSRVYIFHMVVMTLHSMWSFAQALVYLYTLLAKDDVHRPGIAFLLALGDGMMSLLSLSAVTGSAFVTVLFVNDMDFCRSQPKVACDGFQRAVVLGFVAWLLQSTSAFCNVCLTVKLATMRHAE